MINANELRIGNWIAIFKDGEVKPYQIAGGHDIDEIDGFDEQSTPIPINPEVLENCGFQKCDENDWYWIQPDMENIHYRVKEVPGGWRMSKGFFDWDDELCLIENLHHLQNVYLDVQRVELNYQP